MDAAAAILKKADDELVVDGENFEDLGTFVKFAHSCKLLPRSFSVD